MNIQSYCGLWSFWQGGISLGKNNQTVKCYKKNKNCEAIFNAPRGKNTYVCTGFNKKPTKYKKDNIFLCLKGVLTEPTTIEMTPDEALIIISALSLCLSERIIKNGKL